MRINLKRRMQSVLGLSIEDGQMCAVVMERSKGRLEVVKSVTATLSLDLLQPEAELVGREIRNHLEAAGIGERNCAIAVPASWVMSQPAVLPPDLPAEDVESLLQIEAEKGFPCDPDQLQISRSVQHSASASHVTLLAVRKEPLDRLAAVAKAAGLKPLSFPLGLAAVPGVVTPAGDGTVTIAVEARGAAILISAGGGISALRTSEATIDSEAGEKVANTASLARELRITFEQIPADLRATLRHLNIRGDEVLVRQLSEQLGDWAAACGLALVRSNRQESGLSEGVARAAAAVCLDPAATRIEFLPPRRSQWEMLVARYNSKRLTTIGIAVGGAAAAAIGVFGWQEFKVLELRSEWGAMQAQVASLQTLQDQVRAYHPWYDRSLPDLRILARVTQCFPDNGSLTAKSFDVHKVNAATVVSISGTARDGQALLRAQEKLRNAREIENLKVEAISGRMPAQFTLTFRWIGNPGS